MRGLARHRLSTAAGAGDDAGSPARPVPSFQFRGFPHGQAKQRRHRGFAHPARVQGARKRSGKINLLRLGQYDPRNGHFARPERMQARFRLRCFSEVLKRKKQELARACGQVAFGRPTPQHFIDRLGMRKAILTRKQLPIGGAQLAEHLAK